MNQPWLLIDGDYLAWRAFHSTGDPDGDGVTFGFLDAIHSLQGQFQSERIVFAFDCGTSWRRYAFPAYKRSRRRMAVCTDTDGCEWDEEDKVMIGQCRECREKDEAKRQARRSVKRQIRCLRDELLPALGHRNVLFQPKCEADDVIAAVAKSLPFAEQAVIVSADRDLWQLLDRERIVQHNPTTRRTYAESDLAKGFFGLSPAQWANVKALAGCATDDVPGIAGVGNKTAAKWLRGRLKPGVVARRIEASEAIWKRNLSLVRLPWEGCGPFELVPDAPVSAGERRRVLKRFGVGSFAGAFR